MVQINNILFSLIFRKTAGLTPFIIVHRLILGYGAYNFLGLPSLVAI